MKVKLQIEVEYEDRVTLRMIEHKLADFAVDSFDSGSFDADTGRDYGSKPIKFDYHVKVESVEDDVPICVLSDGDTWTELNGCFVSFVTSGEVDDALEGEIDISEVCNKGEIFSLSNPAHLRALAGKLEGLVSVDLPRSEVLSDLLECQGYPEQSAALRPKV